MQQPNHITAVYFDLDGTLVDTAPDFVYVLNVLRQQEQLAPLDETLIRNTVSDGARALITLGFGSEFGIKEGDPQFEALKQRLLDLYSDNLAVKSSLFAGLDELLRYLSDEGLAWGIATNKPERYTTPLLAALKLNPHQVICPDHVQQPKPHPESLRLAADTLNCRPQQIIYVGDHQRDIDCGNLAGCPTIAAAYGYVQANDHVDAWQANHIVYSSDELLPLIQNIIEQRSAQQY